MVSNSRRNVVSALLALSAAILLGSSPGNGTHASSSRSPRLLVRRGKPGQAPAKHRAAITLLLASLPAQKRRLLLEELEGLLASLEARRHPLLVDFAEESPERVAREAQAALLPAFSAAASLVSGEWAAPDGLVVQALPVGAPLDAGVAAWMPVAQADPTLRQVRFLAWPVTCSLVVQFPSVVELVRASAALREQALAGRSVIALIVDREAKLGITRFAEWGEYVALALRLRRFASKHAAGTLLESLASLATGSPEDFLPWLTLHENEILIVPRMASIADARGLVAQVRDVAQRSNASLTILNASEQG